MPVFLRGCFLPRAGRTNVQWSQIRFNLPSGRFQSDGGLQIAAATARWWSSSGALRSKNLKCRSRYTLPWLLHLLYGDCKGSSGSCRALVSIASIRAHKHLVVAQVSHSYIRTGTIYVMLYISHDFTVHLSTSLLHINKEHQQHATFLTKISNTLANDKKLTICIVDVVIRIRERLTWIFLKSWIILKDYKTPSAQCYWQITIISSSQEYHTQHPPDSAKYITALNQSGSPNRSSTA